MTKQEKTELRIEAAKAAGWFWCKCDGSIPRSGDFAEETYIYLVPADFDLIGHSLMRCEQPQDLRFACRQSYPPIPDPIDISADCETLILAMLSTPSVWRLGFFTAPVRLFGNILFVNQQNFGSENPDLRAAYREAITRAYISAMKAEQEKESDHVTATP